MDDYSGIKRSILTSLGKKNQTLQFELRSKGSTVSVEDGIGNCYLKGRNTMVLEIDQRDLGGQLCRLRSVEVLGSYNTSIVSKSFELIKGLVHIEIDTLNDLTEYDKEVLVEIRMVYKLK